MVQLVTDHSPAAAIEMPNINVSDSFTFTHRRFIQHAASGHQSAGAVLAMEEGAYHSVRRGLFQALLNFANLC